MSSSCSTVWLHEQVSVFQPVYRYAKGDRKLQRIHQSLKAYGFYQLNIICRKSQHGDKCHVVATILEHLAMEKEWDA